MTLMSQHTISHHNGVHLCAHYQGPPRYGDIAPPDHFLLSSETLINFSSCLVVAYLNKFLAQFLYLYPTYTATIYITKVECLIFCSATITFYDLY